MISKVYVQSEAGVPSDEAFFKAWHGFGKRRIARELFTSDEFAAGTLELSRSTLVAGAIRIVEAAIDTIGMRRPQANNLPDELHKYFGRRVTKTDLGTLRSAWSTGTAAACFVKPLSKNKLFPAIALFDRDDLATLAKFADDTRVLTSDYVLFESEWRVFVVDGQVIGMSHYQGDCFVYPDAEVIRSAIRDYASAPAGYGIDFGVLDSGATVLVEANDGYSLGSYSLNSVDYSRLLEARWLELAS